MKKSFRIIPLPSEVAETARLVAFTARSDHQTIVADRAGAAPCRHCLRWALPGEAMILFPYQSIPAGHPYAESGPIFVHAEGCERYAAVDEYPAAFREGRVVRGYNERNEIISAQSAENDAESVLEAMLANSEVSFLQVRSLTHGCYTMKVERA